MPATASRTERLEARVSSHQKEQIQRAANLQGRTLTDFVVGAVQAAAEETIRTHHSMLSDRDSAAFVDAFLAPPAPSERLRAAARRYWEFVGE